MKSSILIVDDEPVARKSLTDILRLEGYNVNSVPNGQACNPRSHCRIDTLSGKLELGSIFYQPCPPILQ